MKWAVSGSGPARGSWRALIALSWVSAALALAAPGGTPAPATTPTADAPYQWRNVTVGGGGFSPAVVFSTAERNLLYLRTDIGGLYRRDAAAPPWQPLQDDTAQSNDMGVESVAADPHDPERVYAAVGMYHRDPAAILSSTDRGRHWQRYAVEFRMGGNEAGRGLGERLAIDPNEGSTLYFGSRFDGLQRSTDAGRSWSKLRSFPGTPCAAPPEHGSCGGISFVLVDAASATPGTRSRRLVAAHTEAASTHLYVSEDAGATWSALPQQPAAELLPLQGKLDARGVLYVTYGNGIGPKGISAGAVWRYDLHAHTARDISPDRSASPPPGGYMGLDIDRQHAGTVLVATMNRYHPGDTLWRSDDDGASWRDVGAHSDHDYRNTPYLGDGDQAIGFDHWMAGVAIDPFDAAHALYTTGATIYATHELGPATATAAAAPQRIRWQPDTEGVEETAILTLASHTSGVPLLSGFGDISGFAHTDLAHTPAHAFTGPTFANTRYVDYAGEAANVVVRTGLPRSRDVDGDLSLAWSDDGGASWHGLKVPPLKWKNAAGVSEERRFDTDASAPLIVSADGATFMVLTPVPLLTRDRGRHWSTVHGLPGYLRVIADRRDAQRFYAMDFVHSRLYASNDGGNNFSAVASAGMAKLSSADEPRDFSSPWPLLASPGAAGDLWLLTQGRLLHSTDGGAHFELVRSSIKVELLGFGKAPPGRNTPALYAIGTRSGLRAIWRSDDAGNSWLRINDAQHEYGRRFRVLSGDPRVYGRVYVGTDGRGIVYGEAH